MSSSPRLSGDFCGLALCRESEISRAKRFHITFAQAVERQPGQTEFFSERFEDRFPLYLIRFVGRDAVKAFPCLLVIP
jgi:hypothetical protein